MTHPSDEIYCEKSDILEGKRIVMGITGSIAAVECFGVIRELIRHGAEVVPVMTAEAQKLVTKDALHFASGYEPITELTGLTEHITLMANKEEADLLLIYPATANTISKIANGIDDTPVTSMATVALGSGVPIAIAPAMHQAMFDNPAVKENIRKLASWGVEFIGPRLDGIRAKAATSEEVVAASMRIMSEGKLRGRKVLVIGGRSEESIDSMRIVTNRSSGQMAVSLAWAAFIEGADVELWMGGCSVQIPGYIKTRRFSSVSDLEAMIPEIDHDAVIVPAALADFTPAQAIEGKISSESSMDLRLEPVPKMLPLISKRCKKVIGFKAESGLDRDALVAKASERLKEYGLSAVVANDIGVAGSDSAAVIYIDGDGSEEIEGSKAEIAMGIIDLCARGL